MGVSSSGSCARQHLVQQLESRALFVALSAVEAVRAVVALAELQRDVRASAPRELGLGDPQQLLADALASRRRQDEKLVDLRREPEVLEAEDVDREQVSDRSVPDPRDPSAAEAGIRAEALELLCDARGVVVRNVLEDPVLLDERQKRRNVLCGGWTDFGRLHQRFF